MKQKNQFLWQKTEHGEARLLRVFGDYPLVELPKEIEGHRLTEIGAYCFSQKEHLPREDVLSSGFLESDSEGDIRQQVQAYHPICGDYVEAVILPDTIEQIGTCAFYNCTNLKTIEIGKKLQQVGSDAFMNCRMFTQLKIRANIVDKTGLRLILNQISSKLEVHFTGAKSKELGNYQESEKPKEMGNYQELEKSKELGNYQESEKSQELRNCQEPEDEKAVIFYPEYTESYDEIAPAHIFGRNIVGEGFRARQCFADGVLDLESYDKIFEKACQEEEVETLFRLAWDRLQYPVSLKEERREKYDAYIREHTDFGADYFLKKRDLASLERLFEENKLSDAKQSEIVVKAAELEWIEGTAALLKIRQRRTAPSAAEKYEFEDF